MSNFTFGNGGQSTRHSLSEVKRRINTTCGIYKKYGMSRGYYMYRVIYEFAKYFWEGGSEYRELVSSSWNSNTTEYRISAFDPLCLAA